MNVNFADPQVLQDPYPVFDAIREAGSAVYNPSADAWMIASYDDVKSVLFDDQHFVPESDKWETLYGGAVVESLEEPRHGELRSVLAPMFRASYLRDLRPVITELIVSRLDPIATRLRAGEIVDVVPALTRAVAGRILAHIIGVGEDDVPRFLQWAKEMGATLESYDEPDPERASQLRHTGTQATKMTCAFAGRQLAARRDDDSTNDLIAQFVRSPITQSMNENDQRASIAQVIVAGHDNITHTLGHVFAVLALHPEQRALIDADRTLIPAAVEELLRWRTSASGDTRVLRGTANVNGIQLEDGARVMLLLAAANRDPARWSDPDRFDVTRPKQPHLTFGSGVHTCIGAGLGRLEAQVMFEEVLDRLPLFRIAEPIEYGPPLFMRGPKAVKITL
ncbi:cytochrome P450 [Rhodococcus jostii]|uniref:Cytochrome P450 n=1 Tax=Rhodococcus jostii TaxID=132919 RepID=A0ABU4CEX7_RHOJO|nr:cytochrome P450 [Rhodococcus jostii]MDV6282110.1 cytochrome P450 [Rhodococcus jostii]